VIHQKTINPPLQVAFFALTEKLVLLRFPGRAEMEQVRLLKISVEKIHPLWENKDMEDSADTSIIPDSYF
jgi:hypothetical protein